MADEDERPRRGRRKSDREGAAAKAPTAKEPTAKAPPKNEPAARKTTGATKSPTAKPASAKRGAPKGVSSTGPEVVAVAYAPAPPVDVTPAAAAASASLRAPDASIESATTRTGGEPAVVSTLPPAVDPADLRRLQEGTHSGPHGVLGAHPAMVQGRRGVVVRAWQPEAVRAECVLADGHVVPLGRESGALFSGFLANATLPLDYRLRFHFNDGAVWERGDPYRFLPTIGEMDLHLFNEGTHRRLWEKLGAHPRTIDGVAGVSFAVWAPSAKRASVVGEFCGWDGRVFPMRVLGSSGVFELFIPDIKPGALYKYELVTAEGVVRVKTDPFAFKMEQSPATASIVVDMESYRWRDDAWMRERGGRDVLRSPMSIYEVHLGSWARVPEEGNRPLTYAEIAPRLAEHVTRLGFTHVELLPVMEHPFYGSWGYQVSGYYAPTSRYGTPDEFRHFVDVMHEHGIGVILDWVPAHFPKDDYALRRFDGSALFEHEDPRLGEHPDWGTLIFNYGRNEVRNFLVANALFWLEEYHADGLRVDAVASMLYLDYSRKPNEWVRNRYGGRENLDAIEFLKQVNETVRIEAPGCCMIAEESTAWPGVTRPVGEGGLGFTFKWNMGWMHDTLLYFEKDPVHRRFHHDQITFAMMYEYSERFVMPLSHDEVVHLKGSLFEKMPGDEWQKLANLRLMLAYMFTRPGKKLLFMGTELAPYAEWNHDTSLDWHLRLDERRAGFEAFVARLGEVYRRYPALWRDDSSWHGFQWVDIADRENSVISYARCDGRQNVVTVLNLTPVPRESYRVGVPEPGDYRMLLSSDDAAFGGSGYGATGGVQSEPVPFHGYAQSVVLALPPLGALVLAPESAG